MSLVARQHDGKIKLTWTYTPSFWLDFVPEYAADNKSFVTNEVTMLRDCTLHAYLDNLTGNAIDSFGWKWIVNDAWYRIHTKELDQGDKLKIEGVLNVPPYGSFDCSGTLNICLDDQYGDKVAEFDFEVSWGM